MKYVQVDARREMNRFAFVLCFVAVPEADRVCDPVEAEPVSALHQCACRTSLIKGGLVVLNEVKFPGRLSEAQGVVCGCPQRGDAAIGFGQIRDIVWLWKNIDLLAFDGGAQEANAFEHGLGAVARDPTNCEYVLDAFLAIPIVGEPEDGVY